MSQKLMPAKINALKVNETIGKVFENIPIISIKRTRNLRDLLDGTTIVNGKVKKTTNYQQKREMLHMLQ